jgi:hypothetical protein
MAPKTQSSNYDTTQTRRQAKRRAQFNHMRDALRRIAEARTLDEAKEIARDGLSGKFFDGKPE